LDRGNLLPRLLAYRATMPYLSKMLTIALIPLLVLGHQGKAEADALFKKSEQKLRAAKSLSCTIVGTGPVRYKFELLLQKPKSYRQLGTGVDIYCDGKTQINHIVAQKTFFKTDVSARGFDPPVSGLDAFFGYTTGASAPYFLESTTYRMQTVDGRTCAAKSTVFDSFGRGDRMVYFVDAKTGLPIGWDQVFGGSKMHFRLANLRFNTPVPAGSFTWKPVPGVTERKAGSGRGR
jgi:outer membrane lipoprotein-sorting protein